jgi:hypothetical protein
MTQWPSRTPGRKAGGPSDEFNLNSVVHGNRFGHAVPFRVDRHRDNPHPVPAICRRVVAYESTTHIDSLVSSLVDERV